MKEGGAGGISGSYQTAKGDAAIVSEQSGIHAGEGGFDIKVDGDTRLKGGLITSEAEPENNRLETGTLEFEDLDTHSKWEADTYGGGMSSSGPLASVPLNEGESDSGKAHSAISPGEIVITDPDNQKQNIDDLRRDTTDTNTSLPGIPDLQALLAEQLKTQQLYDDAAAKAAKMIGDYATAQAKAALDNGQLEEYEFWKDGGTGPAILHAIAGGLLGGVTDFSGMLSGMLGGASSALLAPEIQKLVTQFVKDAGLTGAAADLMVNSITGSILQGLGAATGGTGAAYAGSAYQNNYLTHKEMEEANAERAGLLKQIEECRAGAATTCDGGTLSGLQQQLTDSVAYYQLVSDANNAALVEACAASMTSAACQQGLKDLQNAVDSEYGLQARILGTGAVDTADAILLGVLNDAANGVIPVGQIGVAYQQALLKDQQITNSVGALSLLAAAGILVGPEVYTYCLANAASCTAMVTEAVDCFATVACSASAGIMSAGAAAGLAKQLETVAAESGARAVAVPGKTSVYISVADDGTVQYVGITDSFAARQAAHQSQKGINIEPIAGLENISRYDARAVEQVLIETYKLGKDGGSLMNIINSIAKTNPKYAAALSRGNALLKAANYPGF